MVAQVFSGTVSKSIYTLPHQGWESNDHRAHMTEQDPYTTR